MHSSERMGRLVRVNGFRGFHRLGGCSLHAQFEGAQTRSEVSRRLLRMTGFGDALGHNWKVVTDESRHLFIRFLLRRSG